MKTSPFLMLLLVLLSACAVSTPPTVSPTPPLVVAPTSTSLAIPSVEAATSTPAATPFFSQPWDNAALFAPGLVQSQQQYAQIPGATIYHLQMDIDVGLDTVLSRAEIRYTNRENVALEQVELRLFPNLLGSELVVNSLTVDGQPVTPVYSLANSLLSVPLAKPLQPGEATTLGLEYVVSVSDDPEKNYGVLVHNIDVLTLAHAYPMVAVYDENGWHAEIPPESGDLTFTDAAFYVVQVTAPADVKLIATGRETARQQDSQTQTVTFALGPAHDFMLTAVSGYDKVSQQVGEVTINSYAPSDEMGRAKMALETTAAAVKIFNQRYAPYPYTEFDVVATPILALGVEYPGLVAITDRFYEPVETFNDTPIEIYLESTVAHEVGHQWFYNLVGNDQLDQPWLDESLAQFVTWQYYFDRYSPSAAASFKQSLEARWARVDEQPIPVGQPVAAYTGKEYSAIVYGRGALFFLALRDQLGQDKFDAFLEDYAQTYTWGIATTDGLKSLAEKDCGCDLEPLFTDWIYAK